MLLILGFRNLPFTVTNDGVKTVSCIKLFSLFGGILLDKVPGSVIANSKDEDIFVLDVYCKDNSPALYLPPWKKKNSTQHSFQLKYGHLGNIFPYQDCSS